MKKSARFLALGLVCLGAFAWVFAARADRMIRTDKGDLHMKFSKDGGGKAIVEGTLQVYGGIIADGGITSADFGIIPVDHEWWEDETAVGFCASGTCDQDYAIWDNGTAQIKGRTDLQLYGDGAHINLYANGIILQAPSGKPIIAEELTFVDWRSVDATWNGRQAPGFCFESVCSDAYAIWDPVQGGQLNALSSMVLSVSKSAGNIATTSVLLYDNGTSQASIELSPGSVTNGNSYVQIDGTYATMGSGTTFALSTATLKTCTSGTRDATHAAVGDIIADSVGGSSSHPTRPCLCQSNGAGSPTYAWRNIISGTVGNTTTCAD